MRSLFIPNVFTMELRRMFAYRTDFWIQFAGGSIAQFTVAWFLWKSIFEYNNVSRIGEYTFGSMMLYYLFVPIIGRAIRGNPDGGMAEDIYMGHLTRYLVYPVSYFGYKLTVHLANTFVFLVQSLAVLVIFMMFFNNSHVLTINSVNMLYAVSAVCTGTILYFLLISLIQLLSFWADNVWSLVVMVYLISGLLGGSLIPLSLFPAWLQPMLLKLPFAYFMNFPIQCLMGKEDIHSWMTGLMIISIWIIALACLYATIWNRGKYKYTGVGI